MPAARELGIAIVAYSPLGRGFLSRTFKVVGRSLPPLFDCPFSFLAFPPSFPGRAAGAASMIAATQTHRKQSRADLSEGDRRSTFPRFAEANFEANAAAAERLEAIAARKGVPPAALALAWVHSRGADVFPIPGAKTVAHVTANAAAASLKLTPEECAELEAAVPEAVGERYQGMAGTFNSRLSLNDL